jgi:hypothetical protein
MSIQKKSLISNLSTTKKAIVASAPLGSPISTEKSAKMAKLGKVTNLAKLGKMGRLARMAKMGKLGKFARMGKA